MPAILFTAFPLPPGPALAKALTVVQSAGKSRSDCTISPGYSRLYSHWEVGYTRKAKMAWFEALAWFGALAWFEALAGGQVFEPAWYWRSPVFYRYSSTRHRYVAASCPYYPYDRYCHPDRQSHYWAAWISREP
jgi:hypothetical protein